MFKYSNTVFDFRKMSDSCSSTFCLIFSLPKANLTKPRKLLNPELSNETYRCGHSNESSR